MWWSESEVTQSCPTLCDPRLLCPWDFPGKSTRVSCHFLLQEIFPTQGLNPGFTVGKRFTIWATREAHISLSPFFWGRAGILEWVAISFSRRSSWPRDWTRVSHIVGRRFTVWATRVFLILCSCVCVCFLLLRVHMLLYVCFNLCPFHSKHCISLWEVGISKAYESTCDLQKYKQVWCVP